MSAPGPSSSLGVAARFRVHHDDPRLARYTEVGKRLSAPEQLATDAEGLRLVLDPTVADRYGVSLSDDGATVGLWRPT